MVVCQRHVQTLKCAEPAMSAVWPCEETVHKAALLSGVAVACEVKCPIDAIAIYSLCGVRE